MKCLEASSIPCVSVDFDTWEARNSVNSFHVDAGFNKAMIHGKIQDVEYPKPSLVVTATDNISGRAWCFKNIESPAGYVDVRVGRHQGQIVYSLDPQYMLNSLPEGDIPNVPCSERGTMYHTMATAGLGAAAAVAMLRMSYVENTQPASGMTEVGLTHLPLVTWTK